MSKPLVEPIISATPLNWLKNLFIRDSMRDYITAEELKTLKTRALEHEKTSQRENVRKTENTDALSRRPSATEQQTGASGNNTSTIQDKWEAFGLKDLLKAAYLKTYEFDGYDVTTNEYITALGETKTYKDRAFNKLLIIAGFAGFANRPDKHESVKFQKAYAGETSEKSYEDNYEFPKLSPSQFAFNFIGGLHRGTAKTVMKLIQIPTSFVKVVIAAIKLALFIPKLALNIIKVPTEFVTTFIADATAQGIGYQVRKIRELNESDDDNKKRKLAGRGVLIFLLGLTYTVFQVSSIVFRLILSPEKSARIAWKTGRSFEIKNWPKATSALNITLGTLGVLISIGLTIALWSLLIPLVVGAAMTFAPAVVTPVVTWFLQLPLVGTTVGMLHGALVTVSGVIGAAFTPYITAITGLAVGLQIPAEAVALGATLAVIVAPLGSFLSFVADRFSNYWALAGKYGPLGVFTKHYFKGYFDGYSSLPDDDKDNKKPGPGPGSNPSHDKGNGSGTDVPMQEVPPPSSKQTQPPKAGGQGAGVGSEGKKKAAATKGGVNGEDDETFGSETIPEANLNALAEDLKKDDLTPRSAARAANEKKDEGLTGTDNAVRGASSTGRTAVRALEGKDEQKRIPNPSRGAGRGAPSSAADPDDEKRIENAHN